MSQRDYKVGYDRSLHRFVIMDLAGDVIDNNRGFGWKTAANSHRAYGWKRRHLTYGSREMAEAQ